MTFWIIGFAALAVWLLASVLVAFLVGRISRRAESSRTAVQFDTGTVGFDTVRFDTGTVRFGTGTVRFDTGTVGNLTR